MDHRFILSSSYHTTIMPTGGNWKDLVKAAGQGDLEHAKYHLAQGVDPNFQHAEYFTAPIFEAIRNNQLEMVKLLVEEGKANPDLMEEMTDSTPIELALEEEKHDIVDYLNTVLPPESQWKPKHVLVTGGNRGIGKAIVERLLRQGHVVAFTCRNAEAGEEVVQELKDKTGNSKVQVIVGDLSSIASVRALAKNILTEFPTLTVLIHNAGLWPSQCEMNEDGLEQAFMVNYVAPSLLNELVLPQLEKNGPDARVVLVTAGLAIFGKANVMTTPFGKDFSRLKTYMHTKQCGMIWCMHQARKQSNGISFNAVHPGVIQTGLGESGGGCIDCILRLFKKTWKSPAEGAIAPVWFAVSPEAKKLNGEFYAEMEPYKLEGDAACVLDPKVQDEWAQWTKDFLSRTAKD